MENPLSKWQLFLQTGHRWPARERQFSGIILCRGYIAIYRNAPVVGRSCWWLSTHLQSYQTFLITPASTVLAEASEGWKSLLLWLCQASAACRLFHPPIVNCRLPETAESRPSPDSLGRNVPGLIQSFQRKPEWITRTTSCEYCPGSMKAN